MFEGLMSFFKTKPKEEKICDCGCGVSLRMLPYNHDVHDTNAMLKAAEKPVSPEKLAYYRSLDPSLGKGVDAISAPGGHGLCRGGSGN